MTNLLTVGLRGLRGVDGGTIAPAARRATGGHARFVLFAVVTCVAAAAEGGVNILVDAGCLGEAANKIINLPDDCNQCLEEFNIKAKSGTSPTCDILGCAAALAPTVAECAAAIAESGLNLLVDAACLATAADNFENFPDTCNLCLEEFGIKAKPAVDPNPKCDIAGCVAALAPTVAQCASALAEGVLNPVADASCLAAAVDNFENLPGDCNLCLEEFNITPKSAVAPPVGEDPNAEAEADGEGRANLKGDPIDGLEDE